MKQKNKFYKDKFLDLSSYNFLEQNVDESWDTFVEKSPQGTVFSKSYFLYAFKKKVRIWYCLKKSKIKAGFLVFQSDDKKSTIINDLLVYGGILFSPHDPEQNYSQRLSEEFRITSSIIDFLLNNYEKVSFSLSPAFNDLRPFLWHNYGTSINEYKIDLKYTTYIDLSNFNNSNGLENNSTYLLANKSRRQEIRYGKKKKVKTELKFDLKLFNKFYKITFERQHKRPEHSSYKLSEILNKLFKKDMLRMYLSKTKDGVPGSIAIFGLDFKRAYYLFGANNPDLRGEHTGTMVLWDAFNFLYEEGIKEIDLEGVNSPLRGYFKLSFGGKLTPYYNIELGNNF